MLVELVTGAPARLGISPDACGGVVTEQLPYPLGDSRPLSPSRSPRRTHLPNVREPAAGSRGATTRLWTESGTVDGQAATVAPLC